MIDKDTAELLRKKLAESFPEHNQKVMQSTALAEEVGEFVGAARRYLGMARRTGSFEELAEELADVVITAFITAEVFEVDIDREVDAKLKKVFQRGWKDPR